MAQHKIGTMPHRRQVFLEIRLEGDRLSMTGTIGHPNSIRAGSFDSGGQCQDTIREALDSGELEPFGSWTHDSIRAALDTWDRWHLNDMRAGCEHQRAERWETRPIDPGKPTHSYGLHFEGQRQPSWNLLGWVGPDEHPLGLLGKPCPVCGYRYGTAWVTEPLPDDVRAWAASLS